MSTTPELLTTIAEAVTPWWSSRTSGMIGGLAGSAIGVWGAMFGLTAGVLVPKGRGRTAVRILMYPMLILAIAALVVAVVALTRDQPRGVWYPLMLLGGIVLLQLAWLIPFLEVTLRKVEKKKLEAEELRRS
jgi:peptidoglycan/LPS O-acetylase OafA/YrhL